MISESDIMEIQRAYKVMNIYAVLDIAPYPAPRMTKSDKWKNRKCVVEYFAFKDLLRLKWKKAGLGDDLPEVLDVCFVVQMPESWSKKKKDKMHLQPKLSTPDRDNLLKALQDSFNKNDSHVWDGRTLKIWGYEPAIIIFKERI